MYIVTNRRTGEETTCDAIEFIRARGDGYAPAEHDEADGFKALTIVRADDHTESYSEEVFSFEGHKMHGDEPIGSFMEEAVDLIDEPTEAPLGADDDG